MLSVVGDGAFLPFRAALFMTTIMDNAMIAQNTCLQMCVVGRNTFIGAGSTFTDYNLIPAPILARDGHNELNYSNRPVMGGCVGHNCRLGSGMIVFPARTIESDVVLFGSKDRRVLDRDVRYEDSDQVYSPATRPKVLRNSHTGKILSEVLRSGRRVAREVFDPARAIGFYLIWLALVVLTAAGLLKPRRGRVRFHQRRRPSGRGWAEAALKSLVTCVSVRLLSIMPRTSASARLSVILYIEWLGNSVPASLNTGMRRPFWLSQYSLVATLIPYAA